MDMSFFMNRWLWIGLGIVLVILNGLMGIFYIILYRRTHVKAELTAFLTNTPIGLFFQDNKFCEWKPITPINGIIYDEKYGPFVVTTTYVDKKTKNIIIALDVDMDGDRRTNIKDLVERFRNVTNNEKSISKLRTAISNNLIDEDRDIQNITSTINFGSLKHLVVSSAPHNIKSKIEKIVSERIVTMGKVNPMQAIIVFGAIFGIIVIGSILLKIVGK